jgi:hypothetical protein
LFWGDIYSALLKGRDFGGGMDTLRFLRRIRALAVLLMALAGAVRTPASPYTAKPMDQKLFQELRWRLIGPFRGGRTLAVTGVRGRPESYYFGSVGGGVWKTNDAGRTWHPIFDSQGIASIGAIAVAPSDSNVIYVGSGEADMRSSISYGDGMYKSSDGGKTWTPSGLNDSRQIGRILVDPQDPNKVFVRKTGEKAGRRFYSATRTPGRLIWRSSRGIQNQFTRHCGRRGGRRGVFIRLRMGPGAGCIVRKTAATTGSR